MGNISACVNHAGALGEVSIATHGSIMLRYPDITRNFIGRGPSLLYAISTVETGLFSTGSASNMQ